MSSFRFATFHIFWQRLAKFSLISSASLALMALTACSSINDTTRQLAYSITPYTIEVVQGNFVSKEQVSALKIGMSRLQVREVLGSPLLTSVFHADRWDYVFTMRRVGLPEQERKLTVFFKGEELDRTEGGENMPSESEFVAQLNSRRSGKKIPILEANEEMLSKYPAKKEEPKTVLSSSPSRNSYPPLEAPKD